MEPHVDKAPGLGLPQPSSEQVASIQHGNSAPEIGHDKHGITSVLSVPAMPAPAAPGPAPAAVPATDHPQAIATAPIDDTSDDLDQEWVNKAKAIVEKTKNDPFLESNELGKMKADYLKIRYNKQIKVADNHLQ